MYAARLALPRRPLASARICVAFGLVAGMLMSSTTTSSADSRARPAGAFTVNSTLDLPDAAPGDGTCASAPHPIVRYCTLRAAIQETNALLGLDVIDLQAGQRYDLTDTGTGEDLAATGDLDIRGPLTIHGNGATIDGQQADRIFDVFSYNRRLQLGNVTMSGLTVQNGKTPNTGYGGGGILVEMNGNLTLTASTIRTSSSLIAGGLEVLTGANVQVNSSAITNNIAYHDPSLGDGYSGGVGTDGKLTLTDTSVTQNNAVIQGAGIQAFGGTLTLVLANVSDNSLLNPTGPSSGSGLVFGGSSLNVQDSTIADNTIVSIGGLGGGVLLGGSGTGTISGTTISGNNAFEGGGVNAGPGTWRFSGDAISGNTADANGGGLNANGSTLTLTGSTVSGNTAAHEGGGISVANSATVTIDTSSIRDNTVGNSGAAGYGGGIVQAAPGASSLSVTASTISGNQALGGGDGGGLYTGWTAAVTNGTISGNSATGRGGGIYNSTQLPIGPIDLAGHATLVNGTVAGNTAGSGGDGVFNDPDTTVDLTNTVLAGNGAANCSGPVASGGHNLDSGASCSLGGAGDLSGADPLLGPLGANGGPTETRALGVHSPAIDAADLASCPATDQRGVARPQDGDLNGTAVCDMGAYEFIPPPDLFVVSADAPDPLVADQTLTYAVDAHNAGPGTAPAVTLTDQLPDSAMFATATPSQGSCGGGRTVSCDLGALAEGAGATVTITLTPIQPGIDEGLASVSGGVVEVDMTNNATSQETLVTKAKRTAYVAIDDGAFVPAKVKIALGGTVQWNALTSAPTSVSDASGMSLFSSGTLDPPSYFGFPFVAAGAYPVSDAAMDAGTVNVALKGARTGTVGTAFTLKWASAAPPPGDVFDVQVKVPGSSSWAPWQTGISEKSGSYTPAVAGTYGFRARLRDPGASGSCQDAPGQACSGYSPTRSVKVT